MFSTVITNKPKSKATQMPIRGTMIIQTMVLLQNGIVRCMKAGLQVLIKKAPGYSNVKKNKVETHNDKTIYVCECVQDKHNKLNIHTMRACLVTQSVSDSLQLHGLQPARLLCPWDSPGKNTGVCSHSLLQRDLPDPGIEARSPALQMYILPPELPGKLTNVHTKLTTVDMASDQGEGLQWWKGLNGTRAGEGDWPLFTCSQHESTRKQS